MCVEVADLEVGHEPEEPRLIRNLDVVELARELQDRLRADQSLGMGHVRTGGRPLAAVQREQQHLFVADALGDSDGSVGERRAFVLGERRVEQLHREARDQASSQRGVIIAEAV